MVLAEVEEAELLLRRRLHRRPTARPGAQLERPLLGPDLRLRLRRRPTAVAWMLVAGQRSQRRR